MLALSRSGWYHRPTGESEENLRLMRLIDEQYLHTPWYGARQMMRHLRRAGYRVGRKRIRRLMGLMGLRAIYQKANTSRPHPHHRVFPYLLRGLQINRSGQVWTADISYIPMQRGFFTW